jgi:putative transposase
VVSVIRDKVWRREPFRDAVLLTVVQPDTLIRWLRQGWRLFWRWKSRPGRPPIPADLRRLIVTMPRANPTWGEERIADELLLKLGLAVSPRTVGRYLRPARPSRGGHPSQRWAIFVRNHAEAILACDFFITVTAGFRILYVFVVLDIGPDASSIGMSLSIQRRSGPSNSAAR